MSDAIPGNDLLLDEASEGDDTFLLDAVSGDTLMLGPIDEVVAVRLLMIGERWYE